MAMPPETLIVVALVILPAIAAVYGMSKHGFTVAAAWAVGQIVVGVPVDVVRMRHRNT